MIGAGVISAIIAIIGFSATARTTLENTNRTIEAESKQSSVEFLRQQRVDVYAAFANQATQMYRSVSDITGLFKPGRTPPTADEFDRADRDFSDKSLQFAQQLFRVNIIGDEQTRKCADATSKFLLQFNGTLFEAGKFFNGTPFDAVSKTVPLTEQHDRRFADLVNGFSDAASKGVGVERPSEAPAGTCD
ncbi:hypothetical protein A5742_17400 [Mycolicibacterium fortuitum]|uniref:Methyl-accepting chemotaxis protein n=1 Tax=Mycolicibacterium fortuitum TaxID=1766 RepID=A0ABD6QTT7_MYCFO|nr:hypothetical protein A5742_17400 [Mycolicibacterium fortuitum]